MLSADWGLIQNQIQCGQKENLKEKFGVEIGGCGLVGRNVEEI